MHERDFFLAAFDIDDAIGQREYLDSVCQNNTTLRNRLEQLLRRAHENPDFLERPATDFCSDKDVSWIAASIKISQIEDEAATQVYSAEDTGQSVLLNPGGSAAITEMITPSRLGTLFGRYRVERVLGEGGMGIVYLAEDMRLGRSVALKIPRFDADGKLQLIERFRREARTMGLVQHRHLCPIFDVAEQDGQHYLTMAFVDGETLAQIIKRGATFTTGQIAELIRKLALALGAAHRAGVVHRDLKPANVMIDGGGEPIVMDFGLAWMVFETDARVTQSGAIIGTPAYMSPEQAEGDPDKIGVSSDIYSLGAILYELLAGRPIYSGNVMHVLHKVRHDDPSHPSMIRSTVDPQLEAICLKAISRRPEDRFATADEFAEALSSFREGEAPAEPREILNITQALSLTAKSPPKSIPIVLEREQTPEHPRSRLRIAFSGFAAFALLAAILVITTRHGTVEVTSPDGRLPNDVKVVVTRGGEEIELLQADNQWSAKLVNGEYQVQLRSSDDRFEIRSSQLTIKRLGRAVVKLEIRPLVTSPLAFGTHQEALTGSGPHVPLAPIIATNAPVAPTYVKNSNGFTGTWTAKATAAWRGTFTGIGLLPWENTGSHSTVYDFSALPSGVLAAGTCFAMTDLDTVEYLKLKAYDSTHTSLSTPWLNLHPNGQWGKGTGTDSPGQILPTDMPGWEWNGATQCYIFAGTSVVGNPNISFALSSREAIGFLEVSREVTGFNFHLMAPEAAPELSGKPIEPLPPAIAPFDHSQARTNQVAWAEQLGVQINYTNSVGMQFIFIPPGALTMGSTDAEIAEAVAAFTPTDDQNWPDFFRSEGPQHTVRLTQPVYMGIHEVTQAEYEQVLGKDRNRSCFAPLSFGKNDVAGVEPTRHPVEMVSWNDAAEFCAKLSRKEQLKPFYLREGETVTPLEGTGYRLPSEAQWEFACRGGTTTRFSTGDRIADLDAMGWFSLNSQGRTHAVGEKSANPFGLYDMHGNVEEWCQDHYSAYPEQLVENPSVTSTTETRRVIRGGFWTSISPLCRSSHRFARTPESQFNYTGFRVTLDVAAVKEAMAR